MLIRLILLTLMSAIVIGCASTSVEDSSGTQSEPKPVATSPKTGETAPPTTVPPTAGQTPSPVTLTGKGKKATEFFDLEEGLWIVEFEHDGSSNFRVTLLDGDGDVVEKASKKIGFLPNSVPVMGQGKPHLVNEIGSFEGSLAIKIDESAAHLLDVDADGSWSIGFEARPAVAQSKAPVTLTGEGKKATEFFDLEEGLWIVEFEHDGSSNFRVTLLDGDGDAVEYLVNEIGSFERSSAIKIDESAAYLLDVDADGSWSIGFSLSE